MKKVKKIENQVTNNQAFLKWNYKFDETTINNEFESIELSDGSKLDSQSLQQAIKRTTGTSHIRLGEIILKFLAHGLSTDDQESRLNTMSALLPALHPGDETEAMLLGQFLALQESGMKCLRNANSQSMFYHIEKFYMLANKLFNTANQTMQTLLKYRSGGQQTIQVIHFHNEGQAIVAQNLSSKKLEEGKTKSEN